MRALQYALVTSLVSFLVPFGGCGGPKHGDQSSDAGAGSDADLGPYSDFPSAPIVDTGAPDGAPLFGDPASGAATGGPCLLEPEVGTLYPRNWIRPRFSWLPTGDENLFELRLTIANQIHPLVVYTTATTWTMPAEIWAGLSQHSVDQPITLAIRGAHTDGGALTAGPALGSSGQIAIAPVEAPGSIVYWTTSGGTGLRGFEIGDETVHDVIRPSDASSACVGCHSSTPDGTFIGFSSSQNAKNGDPATLGMLSANGTRGTPSFVTPAAQTLMARVNQEQPMFSPLHWRTGDHTAITMYPISNRFEITWTDLEATSTAQNTGWGTVARTGDNQPAASASFAHTSDTLLYVSAANVTTGITTPNGDLMTVPYNSRAGGTPTAIPGASTTTYNEYYPTFSPDDALIAFNRVDTGQTSYANAKAEVFVTRPTGPMPVRLVANDPPSCSGKASPGISNSWPKWAPGAGDADGKRYYWLTFSSTRSASSIPQLYVTAVVDDGTTLTTYPALYLWNQPADEHNHTPAWDHFVLLQ